MFNGGTKAMRACPAAASFRVIFEVSQWRVKIWSQPDFSRQTSDLRLRGTGGRCGGELCLGFAVLRDGELLAARDLLEQIREGGLGFFKGDRLHDGKTLTRRPAQGQSFCGVGR